MTTDDSVREGIARFENLSATARSLLERPQEGAVAVLFRHSIRGRIPKDPLRRDVPLTLEGRQLARRIGQAAPWPVSRLVSSPMQRCRQTAEGFRSVQWPEQEIRLDRRLGDPGPFVVDVERGWEAYLRMGKHALVTAIVDRRGPPAGFREPAAGVSDLLQCLFADGERSSAAATVAFSHDIIMSVLLAHARGRALEEREWPEFHEGIVVQGDAASATLHYRGYRWGVCA